ncbi:leukocyte receptor cluster member 9 [Synchiropus picturatus]
MEVKETHGTQDGAAEATGVQDRGGVCSYFLKGKCHFGHRCRMSHSGPSVDDQEAAAPNQDDEQDGWEMVKKKKKAIEKKYRKSRENEERVVKKKPRMRTADDVISRILWDPLLDEADFVVGYVDRFLGVLERPFSEFNWDTNPCDCDYTTELALPRHRIQYFTYRGHRVWDRHSRTDKVFGSTGQSLAPPFGGEEEVRGEVHLDVKEGRDPEPTSEKQQPAESVLEETEESTHAGKPHLEEETGLNILSTAKQAPTCRNLAAEESQGSCDDVEKMAHSLEAVTISSSKSEETEQRPGGRPPKKKPTHFITFKANTPAILTCFQQLQDEMVSLLPASAPYWQPVSFLHVTLCLLVLRGPAEVAAAVEILKRFAQFHRNPPLTLSFPVKLKHFSGKVLFLSPQPHLALQQFNNGLQEVYREQGFLHRDSYSPRYHLTLAKVTDNLEERMFEGVGDLKVGKGLNFGCLPVNSLHLCVVSAPPVDGFYDVVCTVTLR